MDIPAGDARDAVLRKWAKAAKKNKKGLVPLLLLPLAACGGGGVDSLLTSYDGDVAGAKAVDATNYTSDFTISVSDAGAVAASELTEVAGKTTGDVTSASVTSVSGTAAEVQAALDDAQLVSLGAVDVVITDAHDLAWLAINNATSGSITFNDNSVALSGSSADVAAALTGTTYTGNVTLSDAHDLAQLKIINAGTSGASPSTTRPSPWRARPRTCSRHLMGLRLTPAMSRSRALPPPPKLRRWPSSRRHARDPGRGRGRAGLIRRDCRHRRHRLR